MISTGKLRYSIDDGNLSQKMDIFYWVTKNCSIVQVPAADTSSIPLVQPQGGPRNQQFTALYDCGN